MTGLFRTAVHTPIPQQVQQTISERGLKKGGNPDSGNGSSTPEATSEVGAE